MLKLLLNCRALLAWTWRWGFIQRTTAFRWEVDASLGEFSFGPLWLCAAVVSLALLSPGTSSAQVVGTGTNRLQQSAGTPYQMFGTFKFTSASPASVGFDVRGINYYRIMFVPAGTVSSCALSADSATAVDVNGALVSPTIGGILSAGTIGSCAAPGMFVTSTTAGISLYGQLTPTIVGSGSVTVTVYGYSDNPQASGSAANITGPVDGSGNVKTNCVVGCAAGTPGQQAMAASQPVVLASNQSAVPTLLAQLAATSGSITSTACPGSGCVSIATSGYGEASFSFHGTYSGVSVIFEFSDDSGTTWYPNTCAPSNSATLVTTAVLGTNASNEFDCGVYGATNARARATAYGSGTATVNATPVAVGIEPAATVSAIATDNAGNAIASVNGGLKTQDNGSGTTGAAVPAQAHAIAGKNGSGNLTDLAVDSSGNAGVNVQGTVPTQPSGFASSPLGNQIAVTASAVAIASNATHTVCITALAANTIPVYVGGSGETTSTGFPLNAGDEWCWQVSNSNLLYLIASTTGASIAWTAL